MKNSISLDPKFLEGIAKVCHQANKAYCEIHDDNSQLDWRDAPDWQRISAIKGVEFRLSNSDLGHDASHKSWMKEKLENGWKYGAKKDVEKKEHPCMVPFEELPRHQQVKDVLFCSIVDILRSPY